MISRVGVTTLLIGVLCPVNAAPSLAADSNGSAGDVARKVLLNEVTAESQDHSHWMCRLQTETSQGEEVFEVVETKEGNLKRRLSLNGRPLTADQKHEDEERRQKLLNDPEALRSSMKKENEDEEQSQRMLRMLPDALIFRFGRRRGDIVEFHFTSNPKFHPPSHEAEVFQALEGSMWVNRRQLRLIELTGHLNREVKFGGGLLGHLNRGGEFHVKQSEVSPGYWELTLLNVNMKGKALFFKTIDVQQKMRRSDFRKISDDLTLAQAAELLQKQGMVAQSASSRGNQ